MLCFVHLFDPYISSMRRSKRFHTQFRTNLRCRFRMFARGLFGHDPCSSDYMDGVLNVQPQQKLNAPEAARSCESGLLKCEALTIRL